MHTCLHAHMYVCVSARVYACVYACVHTALSSPVLEAHVLLHRLLEITQIARLCIIFQIELCKHTLKTNHSLSSDTTLGSKCPLNLNPTPYMNLRSATFSLKPSSFYPKT